MAIHISRAASSPPTRGSAPFAMENGTDLFFAVVLSETYDDGGQIPQRKEPTVQSAGPDVAGQISSFVRQLIYYPVRDTFWVDF